MVDGASGFGSKGTAMNYLPEIAGCWDNRTRTSVVSDARPPRGLERLGTRAPPSLLEATALWLEGLSDDVRPQTLAGAFPRIANKLCALWKRPSRFDVYLNQLIIDDRGGRAGFPSAIMKELGTLKAHYAEIYPSNHLH